MSTLFPSRTDASLPLVPLSLVLQLLERRVMEALLARLRPGFPNVLASHLVLFGALDCGATHAADVADRLGISRQAAARTARELEALGLLHLQEDPVRRNRQVLVMTPAGRALAQAGRAALSEIETDLANKVGAETIAALRQAVAPG